MYFKESVTENFQFLINQGYKKSYETQDRIGFIKDGLLVEVDFEKAGYEISAGFCLENRNIRVSLQEAVNYFEIDKKGMYQIASLDNMDAAVTYISNTVRTVIEKCGINAARVIEQIYYAQLEKRREQLNNYYLNEELKTAEKYWEQKEYLKAGRIYDNNLSCLNKVQKKRLEYIHKHFKD